MANNVYIKHGVQEVNIAYNSNKNAEKIIRDTVTNSITSFFKGKEVKVEHVLDLIFPKERRIRSLIGGLETSLGTRLWEPIAKAFAKENGFTINDEGVLNKKVPIIPETVRHFISDFTNKKNIDPTLKHYVFYEELIKFIKQNDLDIEYQKMPKGEGVDVWLEKDGTEYLIDIKTNQINAGSGPKFNANLLNWYAYRVLDGSKLNVKCLIAFPFNPHKDKGFWAKEGGKVVPLIASEEALVGDEFWDFLLGKNNTTQLIFSVFEKLGNEKFGEQFSGIFEPPKDNDLFN